MFILYLCNCHYYTLLFKKYKDTNNSLAVSIKITKVYIPFDPETSLPGIYPTDMFLNVQNGILTIVFTTRLKTI